MTATIGVCDFACGIGWTAEGSGAGIAVGGAGIAVGGAGIAVGDAGIALVASCLTSVLSNAAIGAAGAAEISVASALVMVIPGTVARTATANSLAVWKRSSGRLASALRTIAS